MRNSLFNRRQFHIFAVNARQISIIRRYSLKAMFFKRQIDILRKNGLRQYLSFTICAAYRCRILDIIKIDFLIFILDFIE